MKSKLLQVAVWYLVNISVSFWSPNDQCDDLSIDGEADSFHRESQSKADQTVRLINYAPNVCMKTKHIHDSDHETL